MILIKSNKMFINKTNKKIKYKFNMTMIISILLSPKKVNINLIKI